MNDYNITGDVNCADFIGGDKNITYGFGAEDVQRLIEKVMEMMGAGGVFLPDQRQPDVLQIEHNGETLRFRPGAARQLANQGEESSYLLSLTVDQEYQRWAAHCAIGRQNGCAPGNRRLADLIHRVHHPDR